MSAVNQNPLTIKYRTRLAAAMLLETQGYLFAKAKYSERFNNLGLDELVDLEKTFKNLCTLHARGVARYARELIKQLEAEKKPCTA